MASYNFQALLVVSVVTRCTVVAASAACRSCSATLTRSSVVELRSPRAGGSSPATSRRQRPQFRLAQCRVRVPLLLPDKLLHEGRLVKDDRVRVVALGVHERQQVRSAQLDIVDRQLAAAPHTEACSPHCTALLARLLCGGVRFGFGAPPRNRAPRRAAALAMDPELNAHAGDAVSRRRLRALFLLPSTATPGGFIAGRGSTSC